MASLLLVLIIGGFFALLILALGIVILAQLSDRDSVGRARQGWIQRRSDKDTDEW